MQKPFRFLLLVAITAVLLHARAWYIMPDDGRAAEQATINAISLAKEEIVVAIYSFTNNSLTRALKEAAGRGVQITLLVDESQVQRNARHQKAGELAKIKNITAYITHGKESRRGNYNGLMHLKLCIIDRETIIHGSANWSHNAFNLSYELLIIEEDRTWANALLGRLQPIIESARPYTR